MERMRYMEWVGDVIGGENKDKKNKVLNDAIRRER